MKDSSKMKILKKALRAHKKCGCGKITNEDHPVVKAYDDYSKECNEILQKFIEKNKR